MVRERAAYAETIARVMHEETLPCNLDRRITVDEIPATRAALKLLAMLDELCRAETSVLKMPQLADQSSRGYFRLSQQELETLTVEFDQQFADLLQESETMNAEREERRRRGFGIGRWDADTLENVIAYVGSELRLADWLDRCRKLITNLPSAEATKELLHVSTRPNRAAMTKKQRSRMPKRYTRRQASRKETTSPTGCSSSGDRLVSSRAKALCRIDTSGSA